MGAGPGDQLGLQLKLFAEGSEVAISKIKAVVSASAELDAATKASSAAAKEASVADNELSNAETRRFAAAGQATESAFAEAAALKQVTEATKLLSMAESQGIEMESRLDAERQTAILKLEQLDAAYQAHVGRLQAAAIAAQLDAEAQAKGLATSSAAYEKHAVAAQEAAVAENEFGAASVSNAAKTETFANSVRDSLPTLIGFRTLIRAVTAIFAIGFIVSEWDKLTQAIQNAALALGGFDAGLREMLSNAEKANHELVTGVVKLTQAQEHQLEHTKTAAEFRELENKLEHQSYVDAIQATNKEMEGLAKKIELLRAGNEAEKEHAARVGATVGVVGTLAVVTANYIKEQLKVKSGTEDLKTLQDLVTEDEKKVAANRERLIQLDARGYEQTLKTAKAVKDHADRLAELLQKERDEKEALEESTGARQAATKAYDAEIRAIDNALDAERRSKKLTAAMAREASEAGAIAFEIYAEKLKKITYDEELADLKRTEHLQREFQRREEIRQKAMAALDIDSAKYIASLQKETAADLARGDALQNTKIRGIQIITQEKMAAIESASEQQVALALLTGNVQRYGQIIWETQQRVAAGWVKEAGEEHKATNQIVNDLNAIGNKAQAAYERFNTPLAQSVTHMQRAIITARQQYQVEMQRIAALEREAQALTNVAEKERILTAATQAATQAKKAEKEAEEAAVASLVAGFAGVIAGRRAQAAVEAIWDTAKAIENWAHFAETLDPQFALAAAQYTLAAAEQGKIAGTSSGGTSGRAGGSRSAAGGRFTETSPGSLTPAQQALLLAPGAAGALKGPTGNMTVMVMGEPNMASYISNVLNNHVNTRDGKSVASKLVNKPVISTGRG